MRGRAEIAGSAAARLEAAELPPALVGFDGFVDEITDAVDRRTDMSPAGYRRLATIPEFAARVAAAAGKSTNIELVVRERRWGGNGPLMAGAMASLGSAVDYIGAVGEEGTDLPEDGQVGGTFAPFAARCREVVPVGPPSLTHALEFEDGKIMFNKTGEVQGVTWARLMDVVGEERLTAMVSGARVFGMVNWSLMGGVEGIWEGLIERVFPHCCAAGAPRAVAPGPEVFIDLADPAKRTDEDLRRAMGVLGRMNPLAPVTLGLNLAEAERMATVYGLRVFESGGSLGETVVRAAAALRERLSLSCVVIHPREGAGAAALSASSEERGWFDGPFTRAPALSTGAGDHFNGGFALGRAMGWALEEALALGCAISGAYVRDAASPSKERAASFLRGLPRPE